MQIRDVSIFRVSQRLSIDFFNFWDLKVRNDFFKCSRISKRLKIGQDTLFDLLINMRKKRHESEEKNPFLIFRPFLDLICSVLSKKMSSK